MMFNLILQPLRCAAYIPTITAAYAFVYDHALLNGRHSIFPNRKKHFFRGENDTGFHSTIAHADGTLALLFKFE